MREKNIKIKFFRTNYHQLLGNLHFLQLNFGLKTVLFDLKSTTLNSFKFMFPFLYVIVFNLRLLGLDDIDRVLGDTKVSASAHVLGLVAVLALPFFAARANITIVRVSA
jgi:hypothetical protein